MVRIRVCTLPLQRPGQDTVEDHRKRVARAIRVFHSKNSLPSSLPRTQHFVLTPRSRATMMTSEAQLRDVCERLTRPILMTVTHRSATSTEGSSLPCCRQISSDQRVLYAVAMLSHTEHRMVSHRLAELLANQGSRDFVMLLDFRDAACKASSIAQPGYTETCCSSTEVQVEGARLVISNSL